MSEMNILFLTHPHPNYVPDLLLHGLRKLLGTKVVDYPKKECLYKGVLGLGTCPDDQLCPNWFPPENTPIDRDDIHRKIETGYFSYILSDIRACSLFGELLSNWPGSLVALIDGEDTPVKKIRIGPYVICRRETDGTDFSLPLPMALPVEILKWITSYDRVEKEYSVGFLGCVNESCYERKVIVEQVAHLYPDSLLATSAVPSEEQPAPSGRYGRNDYYIHLQKCKIVLSLPGAGYDTFRFWEHAACRSVHVAEKMPLFIPNDFEHGRHILRFSCIDELRRIIDEVLENKVPVERLIEQGRSHLAKFHLTTHRAKYLLDRLRAIRC